MRATCFSFSFLFTFRTTNTMRARIIIFQLQQSKHIRIMFASTITTTNVLIVPSSTYTQYAHAQHNTSKFTPVVAFFLSFFFSFFF